MQPLNAASPPVADPRSVPMMDSEGRSAYQTHLKPYLAKLLAAIGLLDICYHRGEGDTLYYTDEQGDEIPVLDMLGGYGATLFGHNHPALVAEATGILTVQRPFVMGGSTRTYAGLLAQRLSDLVGQVTGQAYVATLANSGTEAVEAALKHAQLERTHAVQRIVEHGAEQLRAIRTGLSNGSITIDAALYADAARRFGVTAIDSLESLHFYVSQFNERFLLEPGYFLALRGAFHGKSTGALKMTHNPAFRTPWHHVGLQARFIPRNDESALAEVMQEAAASYLVLCPDGAGGVELVEQPWSHIVAILAEPIQGEGGIHELDSDFALALRRAADRHRVPLIFDEIQSGMGRTGAFLASEALGVAGDYYLFSKALGGGLAKVSALLVPQERFIEEFGYLHTSTFADDDFSSAIALKALELVTRNDSQLMRDCGEKGEFLLTRLRDLQRRYPGVIRAVRGRGLMLGIELVPQLDSPSRLLRLASQQKLLTYLVSGYLLHEEGIRIVPTLSANHTIRIEPSAYVSLVDLARFCLALERVVQCIAGADAHRLVGCIVGRRRGAANPERSPVQVPHENVSPPPQSARRVACVAHFIDVLDLLHWDPTLAPLTEAECETLLERLEPILQPFIVGEQRIESVHGEAVALTVIGVPLTSSQIMARMKRGEGETVLATIKEAVAQARELGCTMMGFAGYTSIVTNNCLALVEDHMGLTSGNSLTALAAVEATHAAARQMGIDVGAARLGVVGAVGNIGKVLAQVEAESVGSILLVGRPGAERRLQRVADALYAQAWSQATTGGMAVQQTTGIAHTLAISGLLDHLDAAMPPNQAGAAIREYCAAQGLPEPIQVSTEMRDLQGCDLIITATNAPQPIIDATHIGSQPTVICDVSTPSDVAPAVKALPNVLVIKGGILQLPGGQTLSMGGLRVAEGQAFACISEVLLLGLSGVREHFSYGALDPKRVRQIGELARLHGFHVAVQPA